MVVMSSHALSCSEDIYSKDVIRRETRRACHCACSLWHLTWLVSELVYKTKSGSVIIGVLTHYMHYSVRPEA